MLHIQCVGYDAAGEFWGKVGKDGEFWGKVGKDWEFWRKSGKVGESSDRTHVLSVDEDACVRREVLRYVEAYKHSLSCDKGVRSVRCARYCVVSK